MNQKIKTIFILTALFLFGTAGCIAPLTLAAAPIKKAIDCPSGRIDPNDNTKCAPLGNDCNGNTADTCLKKNPIVTNLNNIVNFLSAGVGIVIVGVIILGGIQYSMAGDSAEAISKAKQKIINGLIALFTFMFMYAFLQWLVPGGVFG